MNTDKWLYEVTPRSSPLDFNLKEIWRYRDLLFLFVKRDIITQYKQTILGPVWYIMQPLLTSIIFTVVFNNIANISTGKTPSFLFNLAGITAWGYFSECLTKTSDTFKNNSALFGKVYFPRVIVPMSIVISNLLKFGIQLGIFSLFYILYVYNGMLITINFQIIHLPMLVFSMGLLGLGLGMIISSMVTKYRDLTYLVSFGIQLLMYMSAVMYPVYVVKEKIPKFAWIIEYNPMTKVIEIFRSLLLENKEISLLNIFYLVITSVFIFFIGLIIFNKTEKTFIDTV